MSDFLNLTTDILDRFQGTVDHETRWLIANDIIQQMGGSALVASEFRSGQPDPLWMMSSMDRTWMTDYMSEEFYAIDPFANHMMTSVVPISWQSGTRVPGDEDKAELDVFYDGLSHVYKSTFGIPFVSTASGTRKMLTFASEHSFKELGIDVDSDPDGFRKLNVVITLLISHIGLPVAPSDSLYQTESVELSPREVEVLLLLAQGHMNSRIAEKMGIAEVTVRKHMGSARRKLDASTREQALSVAITNGLIQP